MALFRVQASYKLAGIPTNKAYIITATSVKNALVKLFATNADLDTVVDATITCTPDASEVIN
jgi:hypothetical protein